MGQELCHILGSKVEFVMIGPDAIGDSATRGGSTLSCTLSENVVSGRSIAPAANPAIMDESTAPTAVCRLPNNINCVVTRLNANEDDH